MTCCAGWVNETRKPELINNYEFEIYLDAHRFAVEYKFDLMSTKNKRIDD